MSEKDKASPRQRVSMEQRWEKVRARCGQGVCAPWDAMHIAGCERRTQKVKITNLNTGATSEATTVKDAMDANDKQAILMEPEPWTPFEKGQRAELFEPRIQPDQRLQLPQDPDLVTYPGLEQYPQAPERPWWKFWGRRG